MDSNGSPSAEVAGGVKLPVAVPTNARELLNPSGKTLTPSRERSFSASSVLCREASPSLSMIVSGDTSPWPKKVFEFYNQVAQQVERLLESVEDEASARKARDELKQARIPSGHHNRMTQAPDTFSKKTNTLVMLLQRIKLQQPVILQPSPTYRKQKQDGSSIGYQPAARPQLNNFGSTFGASHPSYNLALSEQESGSAIPLCIPNDIEWDQQQNKCTHLKDVERTTLQLNPQALEILQSITGPVCVIAIVGPCRSGKSYILSRLISNVGAKCHFDLGHEMDPKTMGIWMWDQPFKLRLKDSKEEVTIILLDTEGSDAAHATDRGDSQIFTLSVLLSSLLIYNSWSVPKRNDLSQMQFVANLSKSIQVQAGTFAEGLEGMKMADSNPRFMWLLRDVILIPTDKNGEPCHIKDYLLQKILVEEATDDEARKAITQCLLSFFSAFDAETLPPPSADPHVMRNIENPLYQKDISPMFLQKVEYVRRRILDNCAPKKGFTGGSVVSGFQLAHMTQLFVDALNSPDGIPVMGSIWQRVLEATYTNGMENALKSYKDIMEETAQHLPMDNKKLLVSHRKGIEESMQRFNPAASLDCESELYQTYLDKLMNELAAYDEAGECVGGQLAFYLEKNHRESKVACQALMKHLKQQHLDPKIEQLTPESDFRTIEASFKRLISEYNGQCVGPASDEVLSDFMEEQEKLHVQLEKQLSTIKNYDDQTKQQMKELKEQQSLLEQKEIEMKQKMEQSRRDQAAKLQALKVKYTKDAENLRQENLKQMQQQEERLRNMSEANLQKARTENAQQQSQLRAVFEQKQRALQQQNTSITAEIERKKNEISHLRATSESKARSLELQNASLTSEIQWKESEIWQLRQRASDAEHRASDADRRASDADRRASDAERRASDAERRITFGYRY